MWFRKKFNRLAYWYGLKRANKHDVTEVQAVQLRLIDPLLFNDRNINRECVETIDVVLPNLMAYVKLLSEIKMCLQEERFIELSRFSIRPRTVTIEAFFTDDNRRRIDVTVAIGKLQALSLDCLNSFKSIRHEQIGLAGFNARMLQKTLVSLAHLADQLREYSAS